MFHSSVRVRSAAAVAVLAALLLGVTETVGRLSDAEAAGVVFRRVTVPAAEFIPASDDADFYNAGTKVFTVTGSGRFTAHIPYEYPGTEHVFITYVQMYAYDNGTGDACLNLFRSDPQFAAGVNAGGTCTTDSPSDPRMVGFNPDPRRVNAGQRSYLQLYLNSPDVTFYGARVTYIAAP